VSQRLEVALVAELEKAYSSGTAPAVVVHAAPYQWANACHDLWEAGRLDIAEYAARHLHAIYPELTYLSTLFGLFDAVPRHLPAPLAFRDEPTAEIQIVRRPDCDVVLLCFCAREGTLGFPLNFIHQWLGRLPVSLVYIKDFRDLYGTRGYSSLGPDRASSVAALRRIARDLSGKRTYVLGVSFGGYPALYYGLQVGAEAVLCLGGMTDLTRDFNEALGPLPRNYLNFVQQVPEHATNLRDIYAAAERRPRVLLVFSGEHPRDRPQAQRLAGLPNVELMPVAGESHHNVVHPLIRKGQFLPLLVRLLSEAAVAVPEAAADRRS